MNLKRYLKIWLLLTVKASQIAFSSRLGASLFLLGKLLRFLLFLGFILLIAVKTKAIAGYSLWQVVLFFATFNLVDNVTQFFLREVYRFRSYVVSGDFDYILTKPWSPLIKSLFGGSDILDLPMVLLSSILIFISIIKLDHITSSGIILYLLLIICSEIIALSFHIAVLAVGILTTEVDNTIMLYRDLTSMGRFPVDIYREPISWIITFVVPVGIMMTYPAKALMGLLSQTSLIIAVSISFIFLFLSFKFWRFSLTRYTSASS